MARSLALVLLIGALVVAVVLLAPAQVGQLRASQTTVDSTKRPEHADSTLWIEMRAVDLHVNEENALRISVLRGQVESTRRGTIPVLDDPASFRIRVTSGVVGLTGGDLAALLNEYVFAYKGSPLRNLRARTDGSQVVISGIMHKGVDLPFEMSSTLSLEPDGRIRSHPTRMRILGVHGALLLHALGLHPDNVLDVRGARGASV